MLDFWNFIGASVTRPCQFYDPVRGRKFLEGERKLMLAVLEDAIDCLQLRGKRTKPIKRQLFQESLDWVKRKDDNDLFSFENICQTLGIDASKLRSGLLRRTGERQQGEAS